MAAYDTAMALLWSRTHEGRRYEVRSAGRTRRLYTDGVFHSQYHPDRPVTQGVWDLLYLPVHFLDHPEGARALVLGVGGGAVLRLLGRHARCRTILGVERDPVHIDIARRFFGVPKHQMVQGDAVRWLEHARPGQIDYLVDDLFDGSHGEPVRAVRADARWCSHLARVLAPGGVIVMNFASLDELESCAFLRSRALARRFPSAFRLTLPGYANAVGVFCRRPAATGVLRRRLRAMPELRLGRQGGLAYRIRTLR